jgi:predicted nucleic acid-binding protein
VRFVDTNVLLYSVSKDPKEADKAAVANDLLLNSTDLALSIQVLQEFYVQATHPARQQRLSHDQAVAMIESWLRFPVQEMTLPILRSALDCAARFQVSYWDAAIVEAARVLHCRTVLSEDLSDSQNYNGVRIINPFGSRRGKSR